MYFQRDGHNFEYISIFLLLPGHSQYCSTRLVLHSPYTYFIDIGTFDTLQQYGHDQLLLPSRAKS